MSSVMPSVITLLSMEENKSSKSAVSQLDVIERSFTLEGFLLWYFSHCSLRRKTWWAHWMYMVCNGWCFSLYRTVVREEIPRNRWLDYFFIFLPLISWSQSKIANCTWQLTITWFWWTFYLPIWKSSILLYWTHEMLNAPI